MNKAVNSTYPELVSANQTIQILRAEVETLKQNELKLIKLVQSLRNAQFGRTTEKLTNLSRNQLALLELEDVQAEVPGAEKITVPEHTRNKKKKKYKELLRERHEYEPEESSCSCCGAELVKIGEEVTEQIETIPAQHKIVEHVRIKKACPKCKSHGVSTGELPAGVPVIPGSKAGASLLSSISVGKYCDHIPLFRQEQMLLRSGIDIPRQRMSDWLGQVPFLLLSIYKEIRLAILKEQYIHADETGMEVRDLEKKKKLHKGYLWGLMGPPGVYFQYSESRASEVADELLKDFKSFLQADAYAGYNAVAKECIRVGCWAHVRRKFVELQNMSGKESGKVLKMISELYKLEKDDKGKKKSEEQIAVIRQEKSKEILEKLKCYLETLKVTTLPQHPLMTAINYALNQWDELSVFIEHPFIELDNNLIENQIRPIAVGRKNWLFAGSHQGAQNSAVLYSIIGTCKMHGVNPQAYLEEVLRRVHSHPINRVSELLPQNWLKARQREKQNS